MYKDTITKSHPLKYVKYSVKHAMRFKFFIPEVNKPAKINITPWPNANKNNINIAAKGLFPIAANAIIPARKGVEHGVPISA